MTAHTGSADASDRTLKTRIENLDLPDSYVDLIACGQSLPNGWKLPCTPNRLKYGIGIKLPATTVFDHHREPRSPQSINLFIKDIIVQACTLLLRLNAGISVCSSEAGKLLKMTDDVIANSRRSHSLQPPPVVTQSVTGRVTTYLWQQAQSMKPAKGTKFVVDKVSQELTDELAELDIKIVESNKDSRQLTVIAARRPLCPGTRIHLRTRIHRSLRLSSRIVQTDSAARETA